MCGICGITNNPSNSSDTVIASMMAAMRHRGPDDAGRISHQTVALGAVRLAILDTSSAGHQPMSVDDKSIWIVYNGEMYNFKSERQILEQKGYKFKSSSDTEVVLKMYREYGDDFLSRVQGIFALAICDKRNGRERLLLARDPMGVKPLLYHQNNSLLVFASEMKSMLASNLIDKTFDPEALRLLLAYGSITQPRTAVQEVYMLLPGHRLIFENNSRCIEPYWNLSTDRRPDIKNKSYDELVTLVRNELENVVKSQMISNVPLGAFLSGGTDAAALVAIMAKHSSQKIKTFSVGFKDEGTNIDESSQAQKIADYIGTDHTRVIVTGDEMRDQIHHIVRGLDQPSVDGVNSYFVSQAAKRSLTVAISGTGGDEIFAGYPWFRNMVLAAESHRLSPSWPIKWSLSKMAHLPVFNNLPTGNIGRIIDRLRGLTSFVHKFSREYQIFGAREATITISPQIRRRLNLSQDPIHCFAAADKLPHTSTIQRVSALCLKGYTQNQLLRDIDTTSMIHSLEVRVPYLDTRLIDLALALPDSTKLGNALSTGQTYRQTGAKRILIDAVRDLLPPDIDMQEKKGFGMPFRHWLMGPLRDILEDVLSPDSVQKRNLFDHHQVTKLKHNFLTGVDHWSKVWLLIIVELWCREVLDNK